MQGHSKVFAWEMRKVERSRAEVRKGAGGKVCGVGRPGIMLWACKFKMPTGHWVETWADSCSCEPGASERTLKGNNKPVSSEINGLKSWDYMRSSKVLGGE